MKDYIIKRIQELREQLRSNEEYVRNFNYHPDTTTSEEMNRLEASRDAIGRILEVITELEWVLNVPETITNNHGTVVQNF